MMLQRARQFDEAGGEACSRRGRWVKNLPTARLLSMGEVVGVTGGEDVGESAAGVVLPM